MDREVYFLLIGIAVGLLGLAALSMNPNIFETEKERQLKAEHEQKLRDFEIAKAELEIQKAKRDSVPLLGQSLEDIGPQIRFLP